MFRRRLRVGLLGLAMVGIAACVVVNPPPRSVEIWRDLAQQTPPALSTVAPTQGADRRFRLDARQAEEIAVAVQLLQAYNAGEVEQVLARLADDAMWSDCDYEAGRAVEFHGHARIAEWLRQRAADGDQLTVASIFNDNPAGEHVIGITYARRTSGTLARLDLAEGIAPQGSTKVIFTADEPPRIFAFANGPIGGDPAACRP